ncbi:N-acetylmuramoyl-L-alanine amidase [Methylobacterium sp. R2-1]|uniref:N-acetylmuramoyl-L-alanine amidase n=1 Tax=Methylobacterium sp. R2-1 TaxID=2587064 RepID=UPI001616DB1C|nr:N-acetylmuramoyl-L-alanine amidase [Methylobacterium sp. R2-1]MBB2962972.1 N-acetyl-anhydromuramyl-L-alanine amidase AmpD [Methylobacterium sp. R2-1]
MSFTFNDDAIIPLKAGHSVSKGWTSATDHKPMGVTWHWTAIIDLATTRRVLGGENATNKGVSSAHYGIGRTFAEGVDRYVRLDNRSWHAGKEQRLRWDGKKSDGKTKGARACIGIETCNVGYERAGFPAKDDWITAVDTDSKWVMKVQPWTDEQVEMMISVGKEIIARWPHIPHAHHHGHHDICPGYKQDVAGFPFATVLRGIYEDPSIPDVWTVFWSTIARQKALLFLGYDLGPWGADGSWGEWSQRALDQFQNDIGAVRLPYWTSFTCWDMHRAIRARGKTIEDVALS